MDFLIFIIHKNNKMKNKKLFRISLFGIGFSLILLSIKDSFGGKILASLAILLFIYMLLKSYDFLKKQNNSKKL